MKYDSNGALLETDIPELPRPHRGKVRDVYDLGGSLLFVATDRISAFDCVMPNGIPDKGRVLTAMSLFWFDYISWAQNHLLCSEVSDFPKMLRKYDTYSSATRVVASNRTYTPFTSPFALM